MMPEGGPNVAAQGPAAVRSEPLRVLKDLMFWAVICSVVAAVLIPFYWLVMTSVKIPREVMTHPIVLFPRQLSIENYTRVFQIAGVTDFTLNSLMISLGATVVVTVIGSMAAYALAKARLPHHFRHLLLLWVLVTRMYPPITTALPYFLVLRSLGLLDSRTGLGLTYVGVLLPLVIWLMYGFFKEIPIELEESALVDGCTMWQRFSVVTLPLAAPALVATVVLSFLTAWNEFLFALILSAVNAKTVPVALAAFLNEKGLEWGPMTALSTLHAIPIMLLAFAVQRYLVSGLTLGAVKG